jgi:hypothetical protein
VADDASAGWYNPAGLGLISGPGVSVTANNFSRSKKIINGVSSQSSLQENSSSLYPGFAGGHTTLGPFALGWSYFTLEQQNTDESSQIDIVNATSSSPFAYNRSELTTGNLIHAGASLALPLGKNMSFGVSEYYYRRQRQTALKERSVFASGVFYDSFVRQSTQNEGTTTVAGLMVKLPNYSLGLSARIPRALSDKTTYETATVTYTKTSSTTGTLTYKKAGASTNAAIQWMSMSWALGSLDYPPVLLNIVASPDCAIILTLQPDGSTVGVTAYSESTPPFPPCSVTLSAATYAVVVNSIDATAGTYVELLQVSSDVAITLDVTP